MPLLVLVAMIISLLGIHAHEIDLLLLEDKVVLILVVLLLRSLFVLVPLLVTTEPGRHLGLPLLPQLLLALFLLRLDVSRGQQLLPPLRSTLSLVLLVVPVELVGQSIKSVGLLRRLGLVPVHMSVLAGHSQDIPLQLQLPLLLLGEGMAAPHLRDQILLVSQFSFQQFQLPLRTLLEVGTTRFGTHVLDGDGLLLSVGIIAVVIRVVQDNLLSPCQPVIPFLSLSQPFHSILRLALFFVHVASAIAIIVAVIATQLALLILLIILIQSFGEFVPLSNISLAFHICPFFHRQFAPITGISSTLVIAITTALVAFLATRFAQFLASTFSPLPQFFVINDSGLLIIRTR
mmetsp:Transcript_26599/g.56585  ORF Transcript_26599/g.56585 Transcript_26599/m.56585 type:complete len:347 (-) Transcript_26599:28-1068(-)